MPEVLNDKHLHDKPSLSYSALLTHDITHITVSQNLLPFLWRDGYLGGRTVDVLMTALPLARLHEGLTQPSLCIQRAKRWPIIALMNG